MLTLQDVQDLQNLSSTAQLKVKRGVLVKLLEKEVKKLQSIDEQYNKTTNKEDLKQLEESGNISASILKVAMEQLEFIDSQLNA